MAIAPKFAYEVRDPIHGLVRLTEQEVGLIDTRAFQRLRRIRQLALASLVYPGALHTRFEHSLGTLQVAQRILVRLDELEHIFDDGSWEVVRLAGLLHDIGHGPFSHVSEHVLDHLYAKDRGATAVVREKIHEKITVDLLHRPEIAGHFKEDQQERIVQIIQGGSGRDVRRDIVSSSLDADKMDYLLRDAHYAGVRYGMFDLDKIIDTCRVLPDGEESQLAISEDGIFAVEQLIHAKHHMTLQVYGHRVRAVTDAMIVRGLEIAVEADQELKAAYTYDGTPEHLDRYLGLDDAALTTAVLRGPSDSARDIYQRLQDRRLYKDLAQVPLDESHVPNPLVRQKLIKLDGPRRTDLEAVIADGLKREPREVIVHKQSVKNPAYNAPGVIDPEAIYVMTREAQPRMLSDFPALAAGKRSVVETLHVIAPWDEGKDLPREERRIRRKELEAQVTEKVLAAAGGQR